MLILTERRPKANGVSRSGPKKGPGKTSGAANKWRAHQNCGDKLKITVWLGARARPAQLATSVVGGGGHGRHHRRAKPNWRRFRLIGPRAESQART